LGPLSLAWAESAARSSWVAGKALSAREAKTKLVAGRTSSARAGDGFRPVSAQIVKGGWR